MANPPLHLPYPLFPAVYVLTRKGSSPSDSGTLWPQTKRLPRRRKDSGPETSGGESAVLRPPPEGQSWRPGNTRLERASAARCSLWRAPDLLVLPFRVVLDRRGRERHKVRQITSGARIWKTPCATPTPVLVCSVVFTIYSTL